MFISLSFVRLGSCLKSPVLCLLLAHPFSSSSLDSLLCLVLTSSPLILLPAPFCLWSCLVSFSLHSLYFSFPGFFCPFFSGCLSIFQYCSHIVFLIFFTHVVSFLNLVQTVVSNLCLNVATIRSFSEAFGWFIFIFWISWGFFPVPLHPLWPCHYCYWELCGTVNNVASIELRFSFLEVCFSVVICLFLFCFVLLLFVIWLIAGGCLCQWLMWLPLSLGISVTDFTDIWMFWKDLVFKVYLSSEQREDKDVEKGRGHIQSLGIYPVSGKSIRKKSLTKVPPWPLPLCLPQCDPKQ